ncbi:MAG TPA: class I SAM-dependent methyltransferase, partial [Spirochaetota bacterium]|nr:class I SAM-dependent methyltransferase [Spirochaetota bacterium]
MKRIEPFNKYSRRYDNWFADNEACYQSELATVKKAIPHSGRGIEIGVGSGRFAAPLGIKEGIEPSPAMAAIAAEKGIKVITARAEDIPLPDSSYDFCTLITTICFLGNVDQSMGEINRILKPSGYLIIGFIDKNSIVGRHYLQAKESNVFYKEAVFFSTKEVICYLQRSNFRLQTAWQTLFKKTDEIKL